MFLNNIHCFLQGWRDFVQQTAGNTKGKREGCKG